MLKKGKIDTGDVPEKQLKNIYNIKNIFKFDLHNIFD
jgi:hypothetical protein